MRPAASHERIVGLDAARAAALLGMFAAHVGNESSQGGWPWLRAADGRSSALFALLAGVSISLMLSHALAPRTAVSRGDAVRHTRMRVAVRGGVLILLGWFLTLLATPVDIILDNLGVMFLLVLPALRWHPWALLGTGAAVLALGRAVLAPLVAHLPERVLAPPVAHELWSAHYPALIWVGYVLIGMGVGRLAPWRGAPLAWTAASGLALAAVAYGSGLLLTAGGEDSAVRPHSYTAFETLGNVGVALLTIAGCSWLAQRWPRPTRPFAAAGSMTLTLYTAQVLVIAFAGAGIVYRPANGTWLALCAAALGFASLWRWRMGPGPLEAILTDASTAVADADSRRRRRSRLSLNP